MVEFPKNQLPSSPKMVIFILSEVILMEFLVIWFLNTTKAMVNSSRFVPWTRLEACSLHAMEHSEIEFIVLEVKMRLDKPPRLVKSMIQWQRKWSTWLILKLLGSEQHVFNSTQLTSTFSVVELINISTQMWSKDMRLARNVGIFSTTKNLNGPLILSQVVSDLLTIQSCSLEDSYLNRTRRMMSTWLTYRLNLLIKSTAYPAKVHSSSILSDLVKRICTQMVKYLIRICCSTTTRMLTDGRPSSSLITQV